MIEEPIVENVEEEDEPLYCEFEDVFRVDFGEYEVRYHFSMKEWAVFHEDEEEGQFLHKDGDDIKESYSLFNGKVIISGETMQEMILASQNVET